MAQIATSREVRGWCLLLAIVPSRRAKEKSTREKTASVKKIWVNCQGIGEMAKRKYSEARSGRTSSSWIMERASSLSWLFSQKTSSWAVTIRVRSM